MSSIDINKPLTAETWRDLLQRVADLEDRLPAREQVAEAGELTSRQIYELYLADEGAKEHYAAEMNYEAGYRAALRRTPASANAEVVEVLRRLLKPHEGEHDAPQEVLDARAALSRATEGGK